MSGQRVKFGSPPGGSSSRSSRHQVYSSDSGVGSSSDNEHSRRPANTNSDRGYAAPDDRSSWNDLAALQESYRMIYDENLQLKRDNEKKRQDIVDLQGRNQRLQDEIKTHSREAAADADHIKSLEKDKKRYTEEMRQLEETNKRLSDKASQAQADSANLRGVNEHLQLKIAELTAPPPSSGSSSSHAATAGGSSSKVHRSSSKREKERLVERFERNDGKVKSDHRTSRHIESYGPGPTQPLATRGGFDNYSTTPMAAPIMTPALQSPTYSSVPRSSTQLPVRPYVTVPSDQLPPQPIEDGNYHPHPLPRERERRR